MKQTNHLVGHDNRTALNKLMRVEVAATKCVIRECACIPVCVQAVAQEIRSTVRDETVALHFTHT
jgi:hypothetical protein